MNLDEVEMFVGQGAPPRNRTLPGAKDRNSGTVGRVRAQKNGDFSVRFR
jgi:hypothetical protein